MYPVNQNYRYTEEDIQLILRSLLNRHGLKVNVHGTVLNNDNSVYLTDGFVVTIGCEQVIGESSVATEAKFARLRESIRNALILAPNNKHALLFPLNINKGHWSVIAVGFTSTHILEACEINSLRSILSIERLRRMIHRAFDGLIRYKSTLMWLFCNPYDYPIKGKLCNRQTDSFSCGPHVVNNIFELTTVGHLQHKSAFTESDTINLRQQHIDAVGVESEFARRQFEAIPDFVFIEDESIITHSNTIKQSFAKFIATLEISEQNAFFILAQEFLACESILSELNNPLAKESIIVPANFHDRCLKASHDLKTWFFDHQFMLEESGLVSEFFVISDDNLQWKEGNRQERVFDGKNLCILVLHKLLQDHVLQLSEVNSELRLVPAT